MIKALSTALTTNLMPFSSYLWHRKIAHKITEERGQQIIWVDLEDNITLVKHYFKQWQEGTLSLPESPVAGKYASFARPTPGLWQQWRKTPVTIFFVAMSIITTILMNVVPDLKHFCEARAPGLGNTMLCNPVCNSGRINKDKPANNVMIWHHVH